MVIFDYLLTRNLKFIKLNEKNTLISKIHGKAPFISFWSEKDTYCTLKILFRRIIHLYMNTYKIEVYVQNQILSRYFRAWVVPHMVNLENYFNIFLSSNFTIYGRSRKNLNTKASTRKIKFKYFTWILYENGSWLRWVNRAKTDPRGRKSNPRDISTSLCCQWVLNWFRVLPVFISIPETVIPG